MAQARQTEGSHENLFACSLGSDTKVLTDAKSVDCVIYKAIPVLLGSGQVSDSLAGIGIV